MNSFVSCIAILIASSAVLDAAPHRQKSVNESGSKFVLPSEWLRISVKNDSIINVPVGTPLQIDCEAVGSPPPTLKWYHHNNLVSESGFPEQNEIANVAIGKLRSRIYIDCVMPYHQGVYTCSGLAGSRRRNPPAVTVFVHESDELPRKVCDKNKPTPPRIVTFAPTLLEFSGRDVILPCGVVGNPAPSVYWINNNGDIIDVKTSSRQYKILENGELFIPQLVWEDMGTYTCRAENGFGEDEAETFLYPVKKAEEE